MKNPQKNRFERIHNQLDEHRNAVEEQIERIHNEIHNEEASAEAHTRRLHDGLEVHHRNVEEQIQKLQEESEKYGHNIEEQLERIQNRVEQTRENAEKQIERIREQIEHNEASAEEPIKRIRDQTKEYRDNSDERVERIRERMEEIKDVDTNPSKRFHFESDSWVEEHHVSDTVQSLINRFDTQYNERHANTTISNAYVLNGVVILKYSGKLLPLSKMDKRYPRSKWLQTLLDKNITIDNLHDYCRYLNARDMLIRIQDKPNVWTPGLFDIPPTENWETYQEIYINQLVNPDKPPHA